MVEFRSNSPTMNAVARKIVAGFGVELKDAEIGFHCENPIARQWPGPSWTYNENEADETRVVTASSNFIYGAFGHRDKSLRHVSQRLAIKTMASRWKHICLKHHENCDLLIAMMILQQIKLQCGCAMLENCLWQLFLENCCWKMFFGKLVWENRIWKIGLG